MKRTIKSLVIILMLTMSSVIFPKQTSGQQNNVDFQVFYDELSPYGEWVDYENYGYVWLPDAGSDFVPYSTDGRWVLSDYGWTWLSDYEWGWAPFHYGRWDFDNYYGWFWVPDNEWGPSWVNWRRSDGYYGWSPMEPGISLNISFGRPYNSRNDHWMFVRDRDFERPYINRYFVNRSDHDRIIRNSTVINTTYIDNSRHTTYVTGPARSDVQRVTGRSINPVTIRENSRPGQRMNNGQLEIYRPQVSKNSRDRNVAPGKVSNLKDVKRPSERSGANQQRNANPAINNGRQQQPNVARPQNNRNAQPSQQQQRTTDPANRNGRQQQQQNGVRSPNNDDRSQPSQQRTATPSGNIDRRQQQNTERQQKNNAQPSQQKSAPANNDARQQQVQQQRQQQQQAQQQRQQQQVQQQRSNNNARQQQAQQQQAQQQQAQQQRQQQQAQQQRSNNNARQQQAQQQRQQQQQAQQQRQQQQAQPQRQQQQQNAVSPEKKSDEQPKESGTDRRRRRSE